MHKMITSVARRDFISSDWEDTAEIRNRAWNLQIAMQSRNVQLKKAKLANRHELTFDWSPIQKSTFSMYSGEKLYSLNPNILLKQ